MKSYAICEVKALADDDPNGSFEAILSAPTLDRDGEIVDPKAFDPLPERIPIDIDHGMTVSTTVGSGVPFYDGDVLKIKGSFSSIPRAQELRTLLVEGHINRMSVTFMDAKRSDKDGVPHVTKGELLNAAFVPIPSNREAAVTVAKAFAAPEGTEPPVAGTLYYVTKDGQSLALSPLSDDERKTATQAMHDMAVKRGAVCSHKTPEPTPPSVETDPEAQAAAPAAAKSPADVPAYLAAVRAQAEAASVL